LGATRIWIAVAERVAGMGQQHHCGQDQLYSGWTQFGVGRFAGQEMERGHRGTLCVGVGVP
jgi:hypothetical protein